MGAHVGEESPVGGPMPLASRGIPSRCVTPFSARSVLCLEAMSLASRISPLLSSIVVGMGLLTLGACGLDGVDDGGPGGGDNPLRIPADDPAIDDRLDTLDIACESTLLVTGTYAAGDPPPADHNGCWPVGTWTINATVDRLGCTEQPELPADHVYDITFDDEATTINVLFANNPDDERVNLKISTAGDGLCHGSMEHFGLDNSVWALMPTLQEDGTLSGIGTYSVYNEDPF